MAHDCLVPLRLKHPSETDEHMHSALYPKDFSFPCMHKQLSAIWSFQLRTADQMDSLAKKHFKSKQAPGPSIFTAVLPVMSWMRGHPPWSLVASSSAQKNDNQLPVPLYIQDFC